jgi:hypothetical protein
VDAPFGSGGSFFRYVVQEGMLNAVGSGFQLNPAVVVSMCGLVSDT